MKHIAKQPEPQFLLDWKHGESEDWEPGWGDLDASASAKTQLTAALRAEQGGICCYCNGPLEPDECHIEHFRPRSDPRYRELELAYDNLLLSCQRQMQKREPRHCGMKKADWFDERLTVSPMTSACERAFRYLEGGKISGATEAGIETCTRLALNIDKLCILRKTAINATLDAIDLSDDDQIREQMSVYSSRNPATGQFAPFCSAVVAVLENYCQGNASRN